MTNEISKTTDALQREWHTLQNNCSHSESLALGIKLLAVVVCLIAILYPQGSLFISLLLALLWLQEAIWKTFQGRTEQRLLAIEKAWANARVETDIETDIEKSATLCFYSHWLESRSGTKALLSEYLSQAIRPTIAYPYIILIAISLTIAWY